MSRALAVAVAALVLSACTRSSQSSDEGATAGEPTESAEAAQAGSTPRRVGTVRGVVRLAEGAELPSYTEAEVGHILGVGSCPGPGEADAHPVKLGEGRALDGVMLSATGDPKAFFAQVPPHTPVERRVVIDGCRLAPRLVVALRGDRLVIQNQTREPMFPVVGHAAYADSLVFGASRTVELERAGVDMISCGVAPFCGRADLIVVMNPVFATTGQAGRFEMSNVPADQPITIHAWHPLFREARASTRVAAGGEVTVDLVLEPRPTPPPPAPAPAAPN